MSIKVLIADDHGIVRDGLRYLLESQHDIEVIGIAVDGRQAVQLAIQFQPEVIVMDIAMPELNGIEATRQIHNAIPTTKIVILSMHSSAEYIYNALQAGASGYLLKESAGSEVVNAVRAVSIGHRYLSPKITEFIVDNYINQGQSPLDRFSAREREVLQMIAEGKTNAEIAEILCLSSKTVETYRSRVMKKLGVNDLPGLVKFAIQHGITSLE